MNEDYTKIDQSHTQINISSGGRRASHDFQQKQNSQVRFCRLKHLYRIWNSESFLCEISAGSLELFWKIYMENFTSDSARNSAQLSLNNSREQLHGTPNFNFRTKKWDLQDLQDLGSPGSGDRGCLAKKLYASSGIKPEVQGHLGAGSAYKLNLRNFHQKTTI